jgi:dolichol-phosphate mannosyltransferase
MDNTSPVKIGVVIPSYNESDNIASLVEEITQIMKNVFIVVVDDSPDLRTKVAVESLKMLYVQVIHRSQKGGRGSAVIEGVRRLREKDCKIIVEMDADFSHPPKQIPELVDYSQKNELDLLIASRYLPDSRIENWPLSRRIFSKFSNLLTRYTLRVPISDYTNGFRVYSEAASDIIVAHCGNIGTGFIPLSEILVNVYYREQKVGEVSTVFVNRVRGESSLNYREIKNAFFGLWKIYALKKRLQQQKKKL